MYLNYNYAIHLIKAHTAKSPINYHIPFELSFCCSSIQYFCFDQIGLVIYGALCGMRFNEMNSIIVIQVHDYRNPILLFEQKNTAGNIIACGMRKKYYSIWFPYPPLKKLQILCPVSGVLYFPCGDTPLWQKAAMRRSYPTWYCRKTARL